MVFGGGNLYKLRATVLKKSNYTTLQTEKVCWGGA